jgi:hypothetical protein
MTHFSTLELYENRPSTIEMEPDTMDEMMLMWKKNRSTGATSTSNLARLSDEMEAFQQRRMENLSWRMMNMTASPASPRSSITPMTSPIRPSRITPKEGRASGKVSVREPAPAEEEVAPEEGAAGPVQVDVRELISQGASVCPPSPSGTLFSRKDRQKDLRSTSPSPTAADRGRSLSNPPLSVSRPRSISSGDIYGTLAAPALSVAAAHAKGSPTTTPLGSPSWPVQPGTPVLAFTPFDDQSTLALSTIDMDGAGEAEAGAPETPEATGEDKEGDLPLFLDTPDDDTSGAFSPPPPRRVLQRPARADSLRINPSAAMVFPR